MGWRLAWVDTNSGLLFPLGEFLAQLHPCIKDIDWTAKKVKLLQVGLPLNQCKQNAIKLKRTLYRQKQAGRVWILSLTQTLQKEPFHTEHYWWLPILLWRMHHLGLCGWFNHWRAHISKGKPGMNLEWCLWGMTLGWINPKSLSSNFSHCVSSNGLATNHRLDISGRTMHTPDTCNGESLFMWPTVSPILVVWSMKGTTHNWHASSNQGHDGCGIVQEWWYWGKRAECTNFGKVWIRSGAFEARNWGGLIWMLLIQFSHCISSNGSATNHQLDISGRTMCNPNAHKGESRFMWPAFSPILVVWYTKGTSLDWHALSNQGHDGCGVVLHL